MTKRDFIALADMIRQANKPTSDTLFRSPGYFLPEHISMLADYCRTRNAAFNRERWLGYIAGTCGPNGGAITR